MHIVKCILPVLLCALFHVDIADAQTTARGSAMIPAWITFKSSASYYGDVYLHVTNISESSSTVSVALYKRRRHSNCG